MVDFWIGLIGLGLIIWYILDYPNKDFTGYILLLVGYVSFEIKEKVKYIRRRTCKSCNKIMLENYKCINPYCSEYRKDEL